MNAFTYRPRNYASSTLALIGAACGIFTACTPQEASKTEEGSQEKIEITSQGAALTAVENTEIALKGVVDSGDFLADSTSLADTLNALGSGSQSCTTTVAPCDASEPTCEPAVVEDCETDEITEEDLQAARDDINEAINELVKRLREEVFIEANLDAEGTNETQVTYRLDASVLCKPDESEAAAPAPTQDPGVTPEPAPAPEPDPECVENANKAKLRVRLSQPNPKDVDVTFIVSDDDFEPLSLQLYDDRLGLKLDLAEGLKAMRALGEDVEEIDNLEGITQLQLVKKAQLDYALQFSVLEDLGLSFHNDNGDDFTYSLTKSSPTMEVALNGNTKTLSATYNYGTLQFMAPLRALADMFEDDEPTSGAVIDENGNALPEPEPTPEKEYTGVIELFIAGYTGSVSYTADSDKFTFSNVSLGNKTSTLKHDGNLLASVDLNPNDGRGFDAVIHSSEDHESALVSIDPTIDLNIGLNFAALADQIEDIPETLLSDKLRMWFEGSQPTFAVKNDQIQMVSGSFHMSSEQSPDSNIDVAEGMCLGSVESETSVDIAPPEGEAPVEEPTEPPVEEPSEEPTSLFNVQVVTCE